MVIGPVNGVIGTSPYIRIVVHGGVERARSKLRIGKTRTQTPSIRTLPSTHPLYHPLLPFTTLFYRLCIAMDQNTNSAPPLSSCSISESLIGL
ncbi:hypothetical protein QA089_000970 [Meyerozyma guilliermondii]